MFGLLVPKSSDDISDLRQKRKQAIRNHKYEDARELQETIAKRKQEALDEAAENIREKFRSSSMEYLDRFSEKYQQILDDADHAREQICLTFHRTFESTQANHQAKLLACERDFATRREHEVLRRIPASEQQLDQSEKAAAASQYEDAITLRNASRALAQQDVETRLVAVTRKFETERQNFFDQFGREIGALSQRFKEELHNWEVKRTETIAKANANKDGQLIAALQSAQQKLALVGVKEPAKVLEGDLARIMGERGLPMPSGLNSSLGGDKKGASRSSRTQKSIQSLGE
jgi:hypothetical protein